jgi:hypothetical protein
MDILKVAQYLSDIGGMAHIETLEESHKDYIIALEFSAAMDIEAPYFDKLVFDILPDFFA